LYKIKDLHVYSKKLSILYVEDEEDLREETAALFKILFKSIDMAVDGEDGLIKYNKNAYDLVISDVNMPNMNGIDMSQNIREINPEQKIVIISAHNESDILLSLIQTGANGFILKPMKTNEMIVALYPVCRDAFTQIINLELIDELNKKNRILQEQNQELRAKSNVVETKHTQLGSVMQKCKDKQKSTESYNVEQKPELEIKKDTIDEYFRSDEDEDIENVLLLSDHCDDLNDIFIEIPDAIAKYEKDTNKQHIENIYTNLNKASTIFMFYSPYLNPLAESFSELSQSIQNNTNIFINILDTDSQSILMLFDAVSSDIQRYIQRFSVESLAMKNIHHIHEPTALSIQQIITIISPMEEVDDTDDIFDF